MMVGKLCCLMSRISTNRGLSGSGRLGSSHSQCAIESFRSLCSWLASCSVRSNGNSLLGVFRSAEYSGTFGLVTLRLSQSNRCRYLDFVSSLRTIECAQSAAQPSDQISKTILSFSYDKSSKNISIPGTFESLRVLSMPQFSFEFL